MQNLSTAQKQYLLEGNSVGVTITVDPVEGNPFQITADQVIEGSFSIERNWTAGNTIEIGCSDAAELIFDLDNTDGQWNSIRWEGAQLTVVLDVGGEPLQAGIFTVDERPGKLTTMQIRALDHMARFNRPWMPGISFPATLLQILQDACSQCNVFLYTLEFDNNDYIVDSKPEGDDITFHHIVGWVAELAGCNAWIDHIGRLQLSWYGDNQPTSPHLAIGPDDRIDGKYLLAEADITITGIVYKAQEVDYVAGTEDYALVIEDNPLLQQNHENILAALFAKIGGFTYRPYEFNCLGYPHLWPGDVIQELTDADGNILSSIITNHTYTMNGNSQLQAKGETETVRGYATGAPFTSSQRRVLQSVAHIEAERQASAVELMALQLNQLMANSLGFYRTRVSLETGAEMLYIHDQPELENSTNIWKYSAEGFAWTDQGWQGGSPAWNYGITVDGNIIGKVLSVIGVKAEWIDAIDLSAITSRFTELIAGNPEAAHLHLGEREGQPYLDMYDTVLRVQLLEDRLNFYAQDTGAPAGFIRGWQYGGVENIVDIDGDHLELGRINAADLVIWPVAWFGGGIYPLADNTHDIGSSSYKWRDLHLSRNAFIGGDFFPRLWRGIRWTGGYSDFHCIVSDTDGNNWWGLYDNKNLRYLVRFYESGYTNLSAGDVGITAGNVGIGQAPDANYRLVVNGTGWFKSHFWADGNAWCDGYGRFDGGLRVGSAVGVTQQVALKHAVNGNVLLTVTGGLITNVQ